MIKMRHGYQGPTDHGTGNSAAARWASAASDAKAMAAEAEVGDRITYEDAESCGEQVWSEFCDALADRDAGRRR